MKARTLKLFALAAAASLPAYAQRVDQIPVTQAGLVPEGGFQRPAAPAAPAPPDFTADEGSLDIPRSLIPQTPPQVLTRYEVHDGIAPKFRRRDIYTKKGLEDLSLREHPGLHVGNVRNLNVQEGYDMFLDEERLERIKDFRDTARAMDEGGDPAEAHAILDASDRAFIRDEYSPDPANSITDTPQPKSGTLLTNLEQLRLTLIDRHF